MNKKIGIPSYPDNFFEMGFTDPPYNVKTCSTKDSGFKKKRLYFDNREENDYFNWCFSWFEELKRICKFIILTPGYRNFTKWIRKYDDIEFAIWYDITKQGGCKIASFNKMDPIIIWNLDKHRSLHKRLKFNVFDIKRCVNQYNYNECIHPCPKPFKLWYEIIKKLKPKSVIDPFIGSGTTAEVCTKLGIRYIGYEINEFYSQDIEKRLRNCKREPLQITLF